MEQCGSSYEQSTECADGIIIVPWVSIHGMYTIQKDTGYFSCTPWNMTSWLIFQKKIQPPSLVDKLCHLHMNTAYVIYKNPNIDEFYELFTYYKPSNSLPCECGDKQVFVTYLLDKPDESKKDIHPLNMNHHPYKIYRHSLLN